MMEHMPQIISIGCMSNCGWTRIEMRQSQWASLCAQHYFRVSTVPDKGMSNVVISASVQMEPWVWDRVICIAPLGCSGCVWRKGACFQSYREEGVRRSRN